MLSAPYRIRGMVTHGAGRGAQLGYATANLEAVDTLLPATGVYAGRAWCAEQVAWNDRAAQKADCQAGDDRHGGCPAAISLGPNPTFGESLPKVEVHLIDCDPILYGQPLEVEFHQRLRGIEEFSSQEALVKQLQRDVAQTREVLGAEG